jgi:hypothetical protein
MDLIKAPLKFRFLNQKTKTFLAFEIKPQSIFTPSVLDYFCIQYFCATGLDENIWGRST